MITRRFVTPLLCLAGVIGFAGCSQSPAEERAEQYLNRVQDAQTSQADPRALSTLRFLESDLQSPIIEVRGINDEDGDQRDDDGRVEVRVADQTACVMLPSKGTSGEVDSGGC
jgi:hypothetical protein